jgi:hypothetical protein
MKQGFRASNKLDGNGIPAGGCVHGTGLAIHWQNGALSVDGERKEPNGAFVEDVIDAAIQRIQHYQETRFATEDNATAIHHLTLANEALGHRTWEREQRGVEGTHEV